MKKPIKSLWERRCDLLEAENARLKILLRDIREQLRVIRPDLESIRHDLASIRDDYPFPPSPGGER